MCTCDKLVHYYNRLISFVRDPFVLSSNAKLLFKFSEMGTLSFCVVFFVSVNFLTDALKMSFSRFAVGASQTMNRRKLRMELDTSTEKHCITCEKKGTEYLVRKLATVDSVTLLLALS